MGLHRGRIHRGPGPARYFLYSYGLSLVFFGWLGPLAPRPSGHAVGARSCARNLNPLVIKSGLYATSGTFAHARAAHLPTKR